MLASTPGTSNPLRYRSYVYDEETGLYYLQSRYYNPEIGRFINADIFVSTGQGILGNNMFAYCLNNPVRYKDTQGHAAADCFDTDGEQLSNNDLCEYDGGGGGYSYANAYNPIDAGYPGKWKIICAFPVQKLPHSQYCFSPPRRFPSGVGWFLRQCYRHCFCFCCKLNVCDSLFFSYPHSIRLSFMIEIGAVHNVGYLLVLLLCISKTALRLRLLFSDEHW